ncbi:MAG: Hsp20 family protein, partial [Rickettsia aeschlimannii]
ADDLDNYMNKNFNYVISLYEDVDQANISSSLKNGILTIILPRIEVKEQEAREIVID